MGVVSRKGELLPFSDAVGYPLVLVVCHSKKLLEFSLVSFYPWTCLTWNKTIFVHFCNFTLNSSSISVISWAVGYWISTYIDKNAWSFGSDVRWWVFGLYFLGTKRIILSVSLTIYFCLQGSCTSQLSYGRMWTQSLMINRTSPYFGNITLVY